MRAAGGFIVPTAINQTFENVQPTWHGCTVAGFSENLHVYSLATDGWGSLPHLGASKVRAFVLSRV